MLSPHASLLAIRMRSSMLSYLGSVGFGMVISVRAAQGASLRPALRFPQLRQTLPVLLGTPTDRAAFV